LISVAAPSAEAERLEAVARELLERLAMQVELRRVERVDVGEIRRRAVGQTYFARVWIAFAQSGRARLYLEHSARDRVLVRDVAADSGNPELVREELGHILQAALEGLQAGEEIGAPREDALQQVEQEEAPSRATAPPTSELTPAADAPEPPLPRRRKVLRFGPRYEAVWLGDGARFEDGPGAVLGLTAPRRRFGVELGGYYRRPLTIDASPVGARLQTLALRAALGVDAWRGERGLLRLTAGGGTDWVRVSPRARAGSDVEVAASSWLKLLLGRVAVTYAHELASFADVELTLGVDLDPGGTHYVFRGSAGESKVLEPWPVRPLISLGGAVP
jgi:hypothetical protein